MNKPISRKQAIRAAAIELFAAKGFQGASTAEVAKLAGVSEGTIFYHFQTKEGILLSLIDDMFDGYVAVIGQSIAEAATGLEAIECYLRGHLRHVEERWNEISLLIRDVPPNFRDDDSPQRAHVLSRIAQLESLIVAAIEKGQLDGSIRPCDPAAIARIMRGLLKGLTSMMALEKFSITEMSDELCQFCRRALAARA